MRIQGYDFNTDTYPLHNGDSIPKQRIDSSGLDFKTISRTEKTLANPNKIITKKERAFFMNMFPDSSAQLSRHVVFNRNGKLQTTSFSKGMFVDGLA
ncbi:MAG: hypothetical protein NT007_02465 [Candidatus Kapabacteria bacterium]|nr:hypothetical protein [Candidatus Kapabacteria bacterium]